jgi:hypothetical protein
LRIIPQIVRLCLLLTVGVLAALPSALPAAGQAPSQPDTQPIGVPEYAAQLRAAAVALDGNDAGAARAFRMALPDEWIVRVDGPSTDAQLMHVKTDWLVRALVTVESDPADSTNRLKRARARLAALREAAEALAAPPAGDAAPDQALARIDHILSDREFKDARGPSWLDKLKARVFGWIGRELDKIFGHMGISDATGDVIAWTAVTLVALLLAFWGVRYWFNAAMRSDIDLRGAAPAGLDWRHWAAEARNAAQQADYRAAIHATYWAGVARLEENNMLPQDRSRTPRESLRLLRQGSPVFVPLKDLTRSFELTWYGYHAATSADWDAAMQKLEALGCQRPSTQATVGS